MTRATVTINGPDDRQKIATWARNVEEGTVVTFRKKSRSSEQSAKMWAMLHEIAEQVEWYGAKLEAEDWKDVMTASLRHARVVPGIDKGTYVPLGMHTSTMTIEEMTNLIELLYAFGSERNVVFKEPKTDTNSGVPSSPPGEADDVSPHASAAADDIPPQSSAASITEDGLGRSDSVAGDGEKSLSPALSDDDRDQAMAYARMVINLPVGITDTHYRLKYIEDRELDFRDILPEREWPKLESFSKAAKAVVNNKRTREQALAFMAEQLECDPEEIGG